MKIKLYVAFLLFIGSSLAFIPKEIVNVKLVFIGDSITEARGIQDPLNPPASASAYLKSKGFEVEFKNQGRSGFTSVDFLPATKKAYPKVIDAANSLLTEKNSLLIFSIMLGTNDSAIKGPNGSPVSAENYRKNIKTLIDSLLLRFTNCKVMLNYPIWYSDSTRNSSIYFVEGRVRLQSYKSQISELVKEYKKSHPKTVFLGDTNAYAHFRKNYLNEMKTEKGPSGVFYLHPNQKGSERLGIFWAKALEKILKL